MESFGLLYMFLFVLYVCLNPSCFGAKGNGITDSTQAFIKAWTAAGGSTESTTIYGTLVAPSDYRVLGQADNWLSFEGVSGVSIIGGELDAKGSASWSCKATGTNCPNGAMTLSLTNSNSSNIRINGLLSLNNQMFHIVINGCKDVHVEVVKVTAAGDRRYSCPIIHGLHDHQLFYQNWRYCISIGLRTKNLWIERVACGPGHGVSLGKVMDEKAVQNVSFRKTIFTATQNGVRINSWARPSNGFVQDIQFMQNVQNPIVIYQNYCPHNLNCPDQYQVSMHRGRLQNVNLTY